jgi:glycosyltransferase involved in cell wall biosynthesis
MTVTEFAENYIKRINPNAKISVINNGVNIPTQTSFKNKGYFLFLSRIDYEGKGIDTLLNAINRLRNDSTHVVIAGNGEKKEIDKLLINIEKLGIKKYVDYIGHVGGEKKDKTISDCFCLIAPSRTHLETSSLVALEAFAFGKSVIGSNVGGLGEILERSKGGLLFEPGDDAQLAKHMHTLLKHPELAIALSKSGRSFAERHSWDAIARQFDSYIQAL